MSLGLCVLVRDLQDSICVRFARAGLFCAGSSRVFVPDCRTGRMLPGAQVLSVLSADFASAGISNRLLLRERNALLLLMFRAVLQASQQAARAWLVPQ